MKNVLGRLITEGDEDPVLQYYHTDHLGSTVALTDSEGTPLWDQEMLPFGNSAGQHGILDEDGLFTGKELDTDTGLYYFNARWYSPNTGRFITEDPARDGLNWFVYCSQNPLIYVDPTGLEAAYVTTPDLPVVHHAAVWFGNEDQGFTFAEVTGYNSEAEEDYTYLSLEPIEQLYQSGAQSIGLSEDGSAGIRYRQFEDRESLNLFLDEANYSNRIEFETTPEEDSLMSDYLFSEAVNLESESYFGRYDLFNNNCGHFATDLLQQGGIKIGDGLPAPISAFQNAVVNTEFVEVESILFNNEEIYQ
ncbi:MAG: RHS repeat-associated core domain-containing protein [Spirochaetia bacterium]